MSMPDTGSCQVPAGDRPWLRIAKGLVWMGVLAALWTVSHPVQAQQEDVIESGRQIFHRKCAVCHGPEGKGDGVLGPHLKEEPADLAHVSRRSGGTFPFWTVYSKIDGREDVAAHGSREMPVWGTDQASESTTGELAMGQILQLVFFVQSIQED